MFNTQYKVVWAANKSLWWIQESSCGYFKVDCNWLNVKLKLASSRIYILATNNCEKCVLFCLVLFCRLAHNIKPEKLESQKTFYIFHLRLLFSWINCSFISLYAENCQRMSPCPQQWSHKTPQRRTLTYSSRRHYTKHYNSWSKLNWNLGLNKVWS